MDVVRFDAFFYVFYAKVEKDFVPISNSKLQRLENHRIDLGYTDALKEYMRCPTIQTKLCHMSDAPYINESRS